MEFTIEDYIAEMISGGYRSEEDFAPIKCDKCESKNLEDCGHYYEDYRCVEYSVKCKDCGEKLGTWAYGSWDI